MKHLQSPSAPSGKMGICEHFGRSTSVSPARTFGIGMVILAIVIFLIVVFARRDRY